MLALKRVYDKASPEDGVRFLVERLWPRGIKKTDLRLDAWLKDVAPSTALRRWFAHDPKKWTKLQERYFAELDSQPEACEQIRSAARHGRVTLVYSSWLSYRPTLVNRCNNCGSRTKYPEYCTKYVCRQKAGTQSMYNKPKTTNA